MGRGKKKTMTLEEYEHFIQNPYNEAFSIEQLNQVIFMHGFKKIHKRPKCELYDALSTIDLINPQRSTLNDKLWPYDSSISLDQVKQDLDSLKWQECPVQSIETIGPKLESGEPKSNGRDAISKHLAVSTFKISRKRRRSKRMRTIRSIANDIGGVVDGNSDFAADVDNASVHDGSAGAAQCDSSLYVDTYSWEF